MRSQPLWRREKVVPASASRHTRITEAYARWLIRDAYFGPEEATTKGQWTPPAVVNLGGAQVSLRLKTCRVPTAIDECYTARSTSRMPMS